MKFLNFTAAACAAIIFLSNCSAQQISNAKTISVKVFGNCGMCEKTIETAALVKGVAMADWDSDSKIAQLVFDSTQTTADAILQHIANAGYDSENFHASDEAYNSLHGCCQYDRPEKMETALSETTLSGNTDRVIKGAENKSKNQITHPLEEVYNTYFALKDALVESDGNTAATHAKTLYDAINQVKMTALSPETHKVWMKYQQKLGSDAEHIKGETDIAHQREHFVSLSDNMAAVMQVEKPEMETYIEHCPMANEGKGANWLSREKAIKNPYYGKSMLTCGKVTATIKI